jgi:hypothetical protein
MQAIKDEKAPRKDPTIRTLKINRSMRYTVRRNIDIPEIKLRGTWLEKLGFQCDKQVDVTCVDGVLMIRQRPD